MIILYFQYHVTRSRKRVAPLCNERYPLRIGGILAPDLSLSVIARGEAPIFPLIIQLIIWNSHKRRNREREHTHTHTRATRYCEYIPPLARDIKIVA